MISGAISLPRNTVILKQTANCYGLCGAVMMQGGSKFGEGSSARDVYLIKW